MSSIRKDLHHNLKVVQAFNAATVATSTTTAGAVIDTRGYGSIEFILSIGTRTDGTYTPLLEESDNSDMSSSNAVADGDLFGTEALAAVAASNGIGRVGMWVGSKRYVRLSVVSSGVTSGATSVHAMAILGTPDLAPTVAD